MDPREIHRKKVLLNLALEDMCLSSNYLHKLGEAVVIIKDEKQRLVYSNLHDVELDYIRKGIVDLRSILLEWFEIEDSNKLPINIDLRKFYNSISDIKV